jgi:hypothetical protein
MSNVSSDRPIGTPPSNFGAFERAVVMELLGPPPSGPRLDLPFKATAWLEDIEGADYLYRALLRLLWERGGSLDAAKSIRRDLQSGKLPAVAVLPDGRLHPLEPIRFRGEGSRWLWFTGSADVVVTSGPRIGRFHGDIYLTAAGDVVAESQPAKTPDLAVRERTSVYKMLLAAVIDTYGVDPTKRNDAAKNIAAASERFWPGDGVSERTVRNWLKAAIDELGAPEAAST